MEKMTNSGAKLNPTSARFQQTMSDQTMATSARAIIARIWLGRSEMTVRRSLVSFINRDDIWLGCTLWNHVAGCLRILEKAFCFS
ncbi:hypothetical protein OGAPHI_004500 [Ogataea philodendri]|uniref:Uncharacterized protein n=1 Tax=Ogataea philodendri TaxID=1378263 RepID=A0A9P8P759_9ASCO|nr:uncharacterized protein OGAPHI_004500 [Ogataea philodendri]KAH3666311.1 hypothetical protein OGAPHI_004500 [Ogataea philodendri]